MRWYERESKEALDIGWPAGDPDGLVEVQVVAYPGRPIEADGPHWQPHPYVIHNLPPGKYHAYTRRSAPGGQRPIEHVSAEDAAERDAVVQSPQPTFGVR